MKPIRHLATCAVLALASSAALAGTATVTFTHPEKFRDVPRDDDNRDTVLKELADHFIKLAARLPANQELKVEVTDVDLAGNIEPNFRYPPDFRVLRGGADYPTMKLRFTLLQDGKVVASGEEFIDDMAYLHRLNRYFSTDPLRYEKQMVDDWFKERVAAR